MQCPPSEKNRGQVSSKEDTRAREEEPAAKKLELNFVELVLETAGELLAEARLVLAEAEVCCSRLSRRRQGPGSSGRGSAC